MIPVRLKLRNFMCYHENVPELSFEGIHTACISGDNGSGKSALIDAITWALWGKSRSKSDDELVSSGQADMEVEFDFRVGQQLYRVIRKRSRPRRQNRSGQSVLELQISSNGTFKPITAETLTQTEQKIAAVLHMDYDTFINSAFLRQGHADEFTTRPPARRKEVLAQILGLSVYDELENEAREEVKLREIAKAQLQNSIAEIDRELVNKPAYQSEHEAATAELAVLEGRLQEQGSRLDQLRRDKERLEGKKSQLAELDEHIRERAKTLGVWKEQIKTHQARVMEYEGLLGRRGEIEAGYAELAEARLLCQALDQKLRQVAALSGHKHKLEMAISQMGQSVVSEHRLCQSRVEELEKSARELPRLKGELEQVQASHDALNIREEGLRQKREANQEVRVRLHNLESEQARLRQEVAELDEKLGLLREQTDKCPLCESDLGAEGRQRIEEKYRAEKLVKTGTIKANQSLLASHKNELELSDKEIELLARKLSQEMAAAQTRSGSLAREIARAEEAVARLEEERKRLGELENRLAARDFARTEQEALAKLEEELRSLDYDPQQHETARASLGALEKFDEPKRRLDEAARLLGMEKEALEQASAAAGEQEQRLAIDMSKRESLAGEVEALPHVETELAAAEAEFNGTLTRQNLAQDRAASARTRLERCAELEVRKKEKKAALAEAAREEGIYRELVKAFGKGGIQAQLIETALPEIEIEANRLLGRMTDNRLNVKFDTQRETRKGDVIETLDINIGDELGHTRSYELFSGGEAFRIDFAVRIALSRLLARRAGAPLPTLIIDEGFGTQDTTGIEKLKEAISSIQDDFEKVLVITHIDELKEAFPVRINVSRGAEGSTFELS